MADTSDNTDLIELDTDLPIWDRFFHVAPLVLVGTIDADGSPDLAPKHMVTPMGWQNYFGFVCSPRHSTCANIARDGVFTVSYPRPEQVLQTSLSASPRLEDGDKPVVGYLGTSPARKVDGVVIDGAYLYLECRHFKTYDDFGDNCLITGQIVAAYADAHFLRASEHDDQEVIHESPLLAYLTPGRFASIDRSNAFPFPADMKK
ncbi:MAG: flavin reductase [Woeseiaceae bacterium]|nr:flavin reductase [Woeseiaceae bacterium]